MIGKLRYCSEAKFQLVGREKDPHGFNLFKVSIYIYNNINVFVVCNVLMMMRDLEVFFYELEHYALTDACLFTYLNLHYLMFKAYLFLT